MVEEPIRHCRRRCSWVQILQWFITITKKESKRGNQDVGATETKIFVRLELNSVRIELGNGKCNADEKIRKTEKHSKKEFRSKGSFDIHHLALDSCTLPPSWKQIFHLMIFSFNIRPFILFYFILLF